MEKTIATFLSILLFSAIGYAAIWESGDAGKAFATDVSVEKCSEPDTFGVYICSGNVVKVISMKPDEPPTFFKPDGRVLTCEGEPTDMGAECVQLLHPNFCPTESVCAPKPVVENKTQDTEPKKTTPTGVGIPDIEPNMDVPEREEIPESEGMGQEIFIFGVILVGMIAIAFINYVYFKTKGT